VFISPDLNGDGNGDLVQLRNNGQLWLYPGNGKGGLKNPTQMGSGFTGWKLTFPGDWNGDGRADLIGIDPKGLMFLYPGNGKGGLGKAVKIGHGWNKMRVIPAGDLTGDKIPDMLAINEQTGVLRLYTGNGKGGFRAGNRQVGHGWKGMLLFPAGDLNRDGKNDILGVTPDGRLLFYAGKGTGTFQKAAQVGHGWKGLNLVAGADMNRDNIADIVGVKPDGSLWFYAGKGRGSFKPPTQMGKGFSASGGSSGGGTVTPSVTHPSFPGVPCPHPTMGWGCADAAKVRAALVPYSTGTIGCSSDAALRGFGFDGSNNYGVGSAVSTAKSWLAEMATWGNPSLKLKIEVFQGVPIYGPGGVWDYPKTDDDPYAVFIFPMVCDG